MISISTWFSSIWTKKNEFNRNNHHRILQSSDHGRVWPNETRNQWSYVHLGFRIASTQWTRIYILVIRSASSATASVVGGDRIRVNEEHFQEIAGKYLTIRIFTSFIFSTIRIRMRRVTHISHYILINLRRKCRDLEFFFVLLRRTFFFKMSKNL